jgi:hypothetical protein
MRLEERAGAPIEEPDIKAPPDQELDDVLRHRVDAVGERRHRCARRHDDRTARPARCVMETQRAAVERFEIDALERRTVDRAPIAEERRK